MARNRESSFDNALSGLNFESVEPSEKRGIVTPEVSDVDSSLNPGQKINVTGIEIENVSEKEKKINVFYSKKEGKGKVTIPREGKVKIGEKIYKAGRNVAEFIIDSNGDVKPEKIPISAYVNTENWNKFKEITSQKGMSANGVLNGLIADYIKNEL